MAVDAEGIDKSGEEGVILGFLRGSYWGGLGVEGVVIPLLGLFGCWRG